MRTVIVSFIILIISGFKTYSQSSEINVDYSKYEDKYSVYLKYADKDFPQNNGDNGAYKIALEEYAKTHPRVPKRTNTNNAVYDDKEYQGKIETWYSNNPFFPRFIPYHNYHKNLTLQDDIQAYEAAVKVWMDKNEKIVK